MLFVVALLGWLLRVFATYVAQPWLWMRELGYSQVFWGVLSVTWPLVGITFALVAAVTWSNLRYADRIISRLTEDDATSAGLARISEVSARFRVWMSGLAAVALAWRQASTIYPQWKVVLGFRWGGSFGQLDPIFGRDLGFYVFSLPFYQMLQRNLLRLVLIQLAIIIGVYAYSGAIRISRKQPWIPNRDVIGHVSLHLALGFFILAWSFYLARFGLLSKASGVVFGVGYTSDHVTTAVFVVMALLSLAAAVAMTASFFTARLRVVGRTVLVFLGAYVVLVIGLPKLVQNYKVEPSELQLEAPYLTTNIAYTRKGFGLQDVDVTAYPALKDLGSADVAGNQQIVDNIPIWNSSSLLPTLRQTQEMRLYYQFYDADVDRYHLADGYRQVLVSARELAPTLPEKARTWVNQHLQFTHGYGLVMAFDSRKQIEGLPEYVVDDIPPKSAYGLQMDQPGIYYGEMMPGFRIVGSGVKEFDYPKGAENVYASYSGSGGVPLNSFGRRLVFALAQKDINILLSSYLGSDSRIQIWRRIRKRVQTIAPFLSLDTNPYPVLSHGRLYWIQDAYTVARQFPYAKPRVSAVGSVSYIRNSVKAVVDAYDGSVALYIVDEHDPILAAYRKAFPDAFKPLSALDNELRQHLRYPKDLFSVQTEVFKAYHMTDPQLFYNQEDLWSYALRSRPKTPPKTGDQWSDQWAKPAPPDTLKPYYILMTLPGSRRLEFVLMTSFTPQNRDNMVAWMAAKCDPPDYGRLVVYELPKDRLSYGPAQVQAMINQNTLISQQLSLWDQKGSHVVPGSLVAVPLADSFLYVQPVYLTAQGLNLPQLKRVIAVQGDRVVMAPTLQEAVEAAVGIERASPEAPHDAAAEDSGSRALYEEARAVFSRAERALKESNWQDFGKAMAELKRVLVPQGGVVMTASMAEEVGRP